MLLRSRKIPASLLFRTEETRITVFGEQNRGFVGFFCFPLFNPQIQLDQVKISETTFLKTRLIQTPKSLNEIDFS